MKTFLTVLSLSLPAAAQAMCMQGAGGCCAPQHGGLVAGAVYAVVATLGYWVLLQAVKESSERIKLEAKNRDELLRKEFEGERNVLIARNESLEKASKDIVTANAKLAQQLEAAYQKVQDIAQKTVEGTSQSRSLADLQKLLIEQSRKGMGEKA